VVPQRIGIVAAEPSGDLLAAGLMDALREQLPAVQFEGVAGPLMCRSGIDEWEPMDSLSVMGLFEVLQHLPRLLRLRSRLLARWRDTPPMAFIGVDAPDFNLTLECGLREAGVPTVHYVSPTVWAWRSGRVKKIRRAVDLLLTIFPFETEFLQQHQIRARYVGHPLAFDMPMEPDRVGARDALGLDSNAPVLGLLPGSRGSEVSRIAGPFIETAVALKQQLPDLQVVVPLVNEKTRTMFEQQLLESASGLDPVVTLNQSRVALAAADVALVASGTATLEGLLSKRPMVVAYRANAATYAVVRTLGLVKVKHVAMANLLADERLAPELIQDECRASKLLPPLLEFFQDADLRDRIARRYTEIHQQLRTDTNREAATAVVDLLRERGLV
jgi:lipid-A-disaccharide synthase